VAQSVSSKGADQRTYRSYHMDRSSTVEEDRMTETLANVLSVLGLAASCLVGAITILVLALASKMVKETRK
jgi:hypothetical protein